jgi:mRNA interferase RelE/StbE
LSDYRIFETKGFQRDVEALPASSRESLRRKLEGYVLPQLREEPHFGSNIRKLRRYEPETWRYRVGRCRIFCAILEKERIVALLTVDDRKEAYR